jgi:hypothetical protein
VRDQDSIEKRAREGSGMPSTLSGRMVAGLCGVARTWGTAAGATGAAGDSGGLAGSIRLAEIAAARLSAEADDLAQLAAGLGDDLAAVLWVWADFQPRTRVAEESRAEAVERAVRLTRAAARIAGDVLDLRDRAESLATLREFYQDAQGGQGGQEGGAR